MSKFLRRPASIELICPTQFGKMFTTSGVKLSKKDKDDLEEKEFKENDAAINENRNITADLHNSEYGIN